MKRMLRVTLMFVLCAMFATAAMAEAEAKAKPAKTMIKGYYSMMANEVELSDAQRAQLEEVLTARQAELTKFQQANGDQLKALGEKLKEAKAAEDKDAANAVSADIRKINSGKAPIEATYKAKIAAILTPEQTAKLEAYHLYIGIASHYSKASLTDEQKTQIKAAAAKHSPEVSKIGEDKKARAAYMKTLYAETDALLSADQLAAMKAPKK